MCIVGLRVISFQFPTYLLAMFVRPKAHHRALARNPSGRDGCRDDERADSGDPRHHHAQPSHPAAVELSMADGMDDLEVALQRDHHKTDLSGGQTNDNRELKRERPFWFSCQEPSPETLFFLHHTKSSIRYDV